LETGIRTGASHPRYQKRLLAEGFKPKLVPAERHFTTPTLLVQPAVRFHTVESCGLARAGRVCAAADSKSTPVSCMKSRTEPPLSHLRSRAVPPLPACLRPRAARPEGSRKVRSALQPFSRAHPMLRGADLRMHNKTKARQSVKLMLRWPAHSYLESASLMYRCVHPGTERNMKGVAAHLGRCRCRRAAD